MNVPQLDYNEDEHLKNDQWKQDSPEHNLSFLAKAGDTYVHLISMFFYLE